MRANAQAIAPGVVRQHFPHSTTAMYFGESAALVAAGVLKDDQLPGVNGNGKTRVTWNPDGSRAQRGGSTKGRRPGRKVVGLYSSRGRQILYVAVTLSEQEVDALEAERLAALPKWPFPCSAHVEQVQVRLPAAHAAGGAA